MTATTVTTNHDTSVRMNNLFAPDPTEDTQDTTVRAVTEEKFMLTKVKLNLSKSIESYFF